MVDESPPELLALDWGTSSVRAFLMCSGQVIETRQSGHGIQHLPEPGPAGFEQAFFAIAGDWVGQWPRMPVVASGMVGSAQGWVEAPYVRCPADIRTLAARHVCVASGAGPEVLIAPGVLFDPPGGLPDVMRGEEIQISGALLRDPSIGGCSCMVLPGTHSKWVQVEEGTIVRYSTYMTGELFSILRQHSILGRLMPDPSSDVDSKTDAAAFEAGLATARESSPGDFTHQIFAARTLGLCDRLPRSSLPDFLSGLLIGHEIVSGQSCSGTSGSVPLILIGAPVLCARYETALRYLGKKIEAVFDNTAPEGLWAFASAIGLLGHSRSVNSQSVG
jgi:2-dehydro-3-deoxygalactonokinase